MWVQPGQVILLTDERQRGLGQVTITHREGDLILGKLAPGPDFPKVEKLFLELEEAINQQMLSIADELGASLDTLGFKLAAPNCGRVQEIYGVQIMSGPD